ncbi:GspE/PulE family protein [Pelotomaculum propionicicum]|uniref:Type II secretion system protein E n=1 Tax=Pelotomaculum propionicicum TaxID=258475 RepID=A0A4Y7RKR7_9FIRM|nr:GspE/PulE family protein [Pelotomaculum propionicicum]TEB09588.1 Type II secretion system protein E [Pelotomaculum propionicicum]
MSVSKRKMLGVRLIEKGLISHEQLGEALRVQSQRGGLLGHVLVSLGMISEEELTRVLGIEELAPKDKIDKELISLVPEQLIRRYKIFPVKKTGNRFYVAMADPLNVMAIDDLRLLTGFSIEPLAASEKDINKLIEKYFGIPEVEKAIQELGIEPEVAEHDEIKEDVIIDEAPVIRLVNSIITRAISEEASDIHIEPFVRGIRIRYRVDGLLREVMKLPRKMIFAIVSRIKVMSNLDIAERRMPQDGRIPLKLTGHDLDLRISTMPTIYGEKVVIRILYKESIKNYTLEKLGFSEHNLERFSAFIKSSYGMLLVTGPTGSGKTTTLYTALNSINTVNQNIITVEDPVEYMLDGVNQAQVNVKAGITFASYLRSILRQDPDIIMIGEIRDHETAEIAVQAAITGHLLLSTLHTNDAPGAVTRLIDMGVAPFMVASSLLGVVAQRLVRRICENCKQECLPEESEIAFAGLPAGTVLYSGAGCEKCNFTGYRGRIAIYEVMTMTPSLKSIVLNSATTEELREAAVSGGMITLKEDGIKKALSGLTTIKEIIRVAFREEKI